MANASNPLRNEAEEFIRLEIARLGPDGLDRGSIVRRFVERGASRTRIHEWIRAELHEARHPPPDTVEADLAVAEAAIAAAQTAKVLDELPGAAAELARMQGAVREAIQRPPQPTGPTFAPTLPLEPTVSTLAPLPMLEAPDTPPSAVPGRAKDILTDLQTVIETIRRVMTYSHGADGKVKNPRIALASADMLRKTLETALKLYEAIDNLKTVERFMKEMLAEVAMVEPAVAKAIVARLCEVQKRWAA